MPPGLFPRSIQVARLLKGLSQHGWQSTIVTPRFDQIADAPVDQQLADCYSPHYRVVEVDLRPGEDDGRSANRWKHPLDERRWIRRAAAAVKQVVRSERSRVLVTFAQPWSDHFVGIELAGWPGRPPWIAHFSDPWSDSLYYADLPPEQLALEQAREEQVVINADLIVFTNEYAAEQVMSKYAPWFRQKVRVLPHIADPALMKDVDRLYPPAAHAAVRPLTIAHVGNLFVGRRTGDSLLKAVAAISDRSPLRGRLQLSFVGEGSGLREAKRTAAELGIEDLVAFHPRQSHFESLASMRDSDVLAMIDAPAERNVFFASKLVDYLVTHRPLLMLTAGTGPSADLARQLGYPVHDPVDVPGIAAAIEGLLERHARGSLAASPGTAEVVDTLSDRQVAGQFAAMIGDAQAQAWSYPWRLARQIKHETRAFVRKTRGYLFRKLTLENHRMNARAYWPEIGPFEQFISGVLFSSIRFHTPALRWAWSNAHRLRRNLAVRAERRQPPRVLHVTSSFDLGGTQTQIKNLCTAGSSRYEHRAIEIFPEMNFLYRTDARIDRARYVYGGFLRRAVGRFAAVMSTRSPQLIQTYKLVQDFKAERPDVVVGWGHEMCATTFLAATIARVPRIVFCIRTFNPSYGWTTPEMGTLLGIAHARMSRYVDAIVTNSTQLRADHANWLMVKEDTITACPNGITIETLPPAAVAERRQAIRAALRIPEGAQLIVNVGRFSAEKGQQSIVEANALLLEKYPPGQVIWLLCGDGPTLAPIRDYADQRGMTNIRFLGRTDRVQDYLCAADIFVMPSDFEGMPNAMMEAMAYGLPCVSTNRSGALDIARDGIEALYYEPRDATQLARHLATLLDDPDGARAMGQRGRERMQLFTVQRFADHFDRILDGVYSTEPTASPS